MYGDTTDRSSAGQCLFPRLCPWIRTGFELTVLHWEAVPCLMGLRVLVSHCHVSEPQSQHRRRLLPSALTHPVPRAELRPLPGWRWSWCDVPRIQHWSLLPLSMLLGPCNVLLWEWEAVVLHLLSDNWDVFHLGSSWLCRRVQNVHVSCTSVQNAVQKPFSKHASSLCRGRVVDVEMSG